jgi:hypothetical protein
MKPIFFLVLAVLLLSILPEHARAVDELPDFFICNYWYDSNEDGYLDDDEYVGIKDAFSASTDSLITFVGYYYDAKDKNIGLKVYEPDGDLFSTKTTTAEFEPIHIHRWWWNVEDLASSDTGEWIAKWYLEDELQATKTFRISGIATYDKEWLDDWLDYWDEYDDEEDEDDFFACNKWVDRNNDDLLDRDEYVGIKESFSVEKDTTITFVSYWRNQKDKPIEIRIFNPNGDIWYQDTATVEYEPTHIHRWWFKVKTMAAEGGLGDWTAKYYLDDAYHTSITVNISKLYESTKLNPQFFTALGWQDKNYDDLIASDYSEFIGIKDTFTVKKDTLIYFYSHWVMKKGMMRKLNIYSPKGELWKTTSSQLKSDDTYWHPSYLASSMIERGGKGNWKVIWYLNDEQVYTKTITLK